MAVYVIKANPACRYLESANATYATARAGSSVEVVDDGTLAFGQYDNSPYHCYEAFLEFDTRAVQGKVLEAKIAWFSRRTIYNLLSFRAQVRAYDYSGGEPTADDWVPGGDIDDAHYPLFATQDGYLIQRAHNSYKTNKDCCFVTEAGAEKLIKVGGYTRFLVVTDKFVEGESPYGAFWQSAGAMNLAEGLEPFLILYTTAPGPPMITTWCPSAASSMGIGVFVPGGITPSTVMFTFKTGIGSSSDVREGGSNWQGIHYRYNGAEGVCNVGLDWKLAESADVKLTKDDYLFSAGTGSSSYAVMFGVLGLDLEKPIIGANSLTIDTVSDTTVVGTGIETSATRRALLMGVVAGDGANSVSGYQIAHGDPDAWQEGYDASYSTTRQLAHALGVKIPSGSTGVPQATLESASKGVLSLVELTPKPATGDWRNVSLVINDDAVMTHDNDVVLSISAEDHYGNPPDEMRIGEGPPTATEPDSWTDWMPFQTEKPWRLAPQTDQDVHRRGVGVEFRNTG